MTETATFTVGDRWIETTPSGREILHEVTELNVKPKHQHKRHRPQPIDGHAVMWPEDILHPRSGRDQD